MLTLRNARLRAQILPASGAGLARLDWIDGDRLLPVLRPFEGDGAPRPNQLSCFPLVPWSNRLAGGFSFGGHTYSIAPNRPDDPYPMHGHGWQQGWMVRELSGSAVTLALDWRAAAPFSYQASLTYALVDDALEVTLAVTNSGALALPFGLGLHPWLPRSAGVTLQARAARVWLAQPDKLPSHPVAPPPAWDFATPRPLPPDGIDHVFEGWDGAARVVWPESGLALGIAADCGHYIVYAPPGASFFCFEPVDHLINAHNTPGSHGLTVLAPGQSLQRSFRFAVSQL